MKDNSKRDSRFLATLAHLLTVSLLTRGTLVYSFSCNLCPQYNTSKLGLQTKDLY